jgi:dCMP deaminase
MTAPIPFKRATWDRRFMDLALVARSWVKGPDLGVGAIIVSPDKRGFSAGFSGLPRGMDDTVERITDPGFKDHHIVHAELNAILNAPGPVVGWTIYVTSCPCAQCASAIIQAGIVRVVAPKFDTSSRWVRSQLAGQAAFDECGIVREYMEAAL